MIVGYQIEDSSGKCLDKLTNLILISNENPICLYLKLIFRLCKFYYWTCSCKQKCVLHVNSIRDCFFLLLPVRVYLENLLRIAVRVTILSSQNKHLWNAIVWKGFCKKSFGKTILCISHTFIDYYICNIWNIFETVCTSHFLWVLFLLSCLLWVRKCIKSKCKRKNKYWR